MPFCTHFCQRGDLREKGCLFAVFSQSAGDSKHFANAYKEIFVKMGEWGSTILTVITTNKVA
ncbi:hypothetical protein [Paenibacillus oryzisoli]|uniref:hypothetical protein n=1 Tax=Paenibacillus oryzisoli TaxID=1850517 RepID=UPI0019576C78|nr:hypothetical protein [Paenibacillus oryzisoli]